MIDMKKNINTRDYWEYRFSSGDWSLKQGENQTKNFALGQVPHLNIDKNFNGTILDFGCGLGDAIPVYKDYYPNAHLIGVDISQSAIEQCMTKYGNLAKFIKGECEDVPNVDVIIASNVFEHLDGDKEIASRLLAKCNSLYIIVPYKESPLIHEHINYYDKDSFNLLNCSSAQVFKCKGWTPDGIKGLYFNIYFKNIFRFLFRRQLHSRGKQIVFHLQK